jgi:2-polyprenyl-6-methoxyphenol hydroxylase-like FAD-dependent oxidoreductase
MVDLGRHAIVIGASMGVLLAARALADHYENVTVLERDALPEARRAKTCHKDAARIGYAPPASTIGAAR